MEKKKESPKGKVVTGKKDALGKGIRSLLQNINSDLSATEKNWSDGNAGVSSAISRIPLINIEVNPNQPRKDFDKAALQELAESIRIHDIIQPLTITRIGKDKYQIIAGERRFRAAKLAGKKDVPAYIRDTNDSQILELALLENLQREDLNSIEIALSYRELMDEMSYTQEELAHRMGKERSTITNYLRLLKLPPDIQVAVRAGELSMGHARALINIETVDRQLFVFKEIKNKGLSVRQTEALVRRLVSDAKPKTVKGAQLSPAMKKIEDKLASEFSTKVKLNTGKSGSGTILFEYYSIQELNSLLEKFQVHLD